MLWVPEHCRDDVSDRGVRRTRPPRTFLQSIVLEFKTRAGYALLQKICESASVRGAEIGEEEADLPGEVGELRAFWLVN